MLLVANLSALEHAHAHEIEAEGVDLRLDDLGNARDIRHAISI
jgi:hypothetical protein